MGSGETFRHLVSSLDTSKPPQEKVLILQQLSDVWIKVDKAEAKTIMAGNNVLPLLANVMEENFGEWHTQWPAWINNLIKQVPNSRGAGELFPLEQMKEVLNEFRKYIINGCSDAFYGIAQLVRFKDIRQIVLNDEELYNKTKEHINEYGALLYLYNVALSEEWQFKILHDKQCVIDLLNLPESRDVWNVFVNIARHPDAKILLPREIVTKASKSTYIRCVDICALLCSENDLKEFKLPTDWIECTSDLLHSLVKNGTASLGGHAYDLLDLILPIANLSVADAEKEPLGKKVIPLLMEVVTGVLPNVASITNYLARGKQEAARALWNFAYLESNRALITESHGINKLKSVVEHTEDLVVKKNILGIIHMCTTPLEPFPLDVDASKSAAKHKRGHVMISYQWDDQKIVMRISQSLKQKGYKVWLDLEQMGGSTLEAMSHAIEQSELVLLCMSQKYKDSPNCRLEGEYCINRRVPFLPLMMQQGYNPDGWLGITLGSRLYYDFTNEENFNAKIDYLTNAIGEKGLHSIEYTPISTHEVKKSIADWTPEDMTNWMKENHIEHLQELFDKHKIDGVALLELKRLHTIDLSYCLDLVSKLLQIVELGEILKISSAIHKLV
eukprot:Phypoly_transcript_05647.p1 GENE.Phypoly_transcript_05647~~Phypoly_transcript_05647.p1  ORF type:complete len:615 (-),score=88.60 Phypoly_transcript_05647:6-1850(-)